MCTMIMTLKKKKKKEKKMGIVDSEVFSMPRFHTDFAQVDLFLTGWKKITPTSTLRKYV